MLFYFTLQCATFFLAMSDTQKQQLTIVLVIFQLYYTFKM
jgi:hypothetical protein